MSNTLKKNKSLNTTLLDEDKKEETDGDDGDGTYSNEAMTFNVVVNLKATSLHDDDNSVGDDDSLY